MHGFYEFFRAEGRPWVRLKAANSRPKIKWNGVGRCESDGDGLLCEVLNIGSNEAINQLSSKRQVYQHHEERRWVEERPQEV
eukprot:1160026-Pelagomonas_calceolata.AAC.1